jgi:glycosyltransferase involved in cell wall biosynthesis
LNNSKIGDEAAIDARSLDVILLSLVVPVFNEMKTVEYFCEEVFKAFRAVNNIKLEILFINDGSTDGTLSRLLELQASYPQIIIVDLSRNFGKEAALTAGLIESKGHIVVPIDVDMQDPPEIIHEMISKWRLGYEVVVGRRVNRNSDSIFKRITAFSFYRVHNMLSELQIPEDVGDFRLMDRVVVNAINTLPESRRFMKGLFAWAGFKTVEIGYSRPIRSAGVSKFNGWHLWNFALEGLTSFSTVPLRIWTYIGLACALIAIGFGVFISLRVFIQGVDVPGYASVVVIVSFLGGMQLVGIGVIGEYLGRVYVESKQRPIYLVRRVYGKRLLNGFKGN